jgi:Biotin-lipoyl like
MKWRDKYSTEFTILEELRLPSSSRTIRNLLFWLIIVVVLALIFVPWVQTAYGIGQVITINPGDRVQTLNALVDGRIKEWHVSDGTLVKKGEPIVEIMDNDPLLLDRLRAERDALQRNYEVAEMAAKTGKLNADRKNDLVQQGLSAPREYEKARIDYKSLLAKEAQALAKLQQIKTKLSRQDTQTLYAPRDGRILSIVSGDVATTVKSGDPLVVFAPEDAVFAVELYIDGLDVPLVYPGRLARLQFEGWPMLQISGWPSKAVGTFGAKVVTVDPSAGINGKFRVILEPDGDDPWPQKEFLRYGTHLKGWVLLEEVPLGYELWRQVNNFPPEFSELLKQQQQNNIGSNNDTPKQSKEADK